MLLNTTSTGPLIYVGPRDALLFYVLSDRYIEIQQGIATNGEMKGLS